MSGEARDILVVDDTPANLRLLSEMLGGEGYRVRPVTSGGQALRAVQAALPDLVLLDIHMPDLDGYQVLEQLRQVPELQNTPVVAITANAMPSDVAHGLRAGFTDYLTKPLDSSTFLPTISQWLP